MMSPTDKPVTKRRADRSTMEAFAFSFFCDICGKEWRSEQYAFNAGDLATPIPPAVYQILWNDQHKAASERASRDALFQFNRCPVCGRRVCKDCFHLSEVDVSDICVDCLQKKQRGDNKAMSGKNLESFMDTPLLGPITKGFTDRSTPKVFAFSFYCDTCEKEWRSTPQAFDPGELRSPTDFRVFRMLWNEHRKTAYEQANLEAIYVFHYCPKCGRRMCMECFQRSETDIADICKGCLTNLDISRPFHGMKGKGSGPPFRLMPMHMRENQDVSNGVDNLRRLTP